MLCYTLSTIILKKQNQVLKIKKKLKTYFLFLVFTRNSQLLLKKLEENKQKFQNRKLKTKSLSS